MNEREELIMLIKNHPEICENLLELLRLIKGQKPLDPKDREQLE